MGFLVTENPSLIYGDSMKILLLGGNGYIGSKFYPTIKDKHTVKSIDLCLFQKDLGYSEKINFNSVDITEYDIIIWFYNAQKITFMAFHEGFEILCFFGTDAY